MTELVQTVQSVEATHVPRLRAAYEKCLPELQAIDKDTLLTVNRDIPTVVAGILGAISEIRTLKEECILQTPRVDAGIFDKLEEQALALSYAQSVHLAASTPTLALPELSARVTLLRADFEAVCVGLARYNLVDGTRLEELKGPIGYKNQASDLMVLVAILRNAWPRIEGKTPITAAQIDEAEVQADRLLTSVGEREQLPAATVASAETLRRAFTQFMGTYDQVRRVASFLRWEHGDVDEYVPSFGTGGGRRKAGAPADATPPKSVLPAPGAAPTSASAQPAVAAPAAAPGMPGSDPFIRN